MARSSKRWLRAHERDPYVRKSRQSEYRSRAAWKLMEIDQHDRLFRPGQLVVDLGAAPGSWSQYAASRVGPRGRVIAVDVLPMAPVAGVEFMQGDFADAAVQARCLEALGDRRADLVISDMAPNLSGIRATDQARSMRLAELALEFARQVLAPGGDLLLKLFQGSGADAFRKELVEHFQRVNIRKPGASRSASREFYVLARGHKV
jgi:23S rRNA (uridine2552-2'-O)-methyltransferase